jgi:shikimate dehydrogenase
VTPITGATRVAGVIGDPVRHSLSPVLHNAAYQTMGLDWTYVAFEVPDGATKDALEAMRALGLAGLSVTMPHKTAAAHACDELADDAATLLSVNTVTAVDGRLVGSSTDGEGFLRSLADAGVDPSGQTVLLLGAGGAARAVSLALGRAGAQVRVSARNSAAAAETAGLGRGSVEPWEDRHECALRSRIVVNATPIGMAGRDPDGMPINPDQIEAAHTYIDLVYHPLETNFLRVARERAAARVDGLGMLVHQAALQVERWTGFDAPVDAMRTAAKAALANSR